MHLTEKTPQEHLQRWCSSFFLIHKMKPTSILKKKSSIYTFFKYCQHFWFFKYLKVCYRKRNLIISTRESCSIKKGNNNLTVYCPHKRSPARLTQYYVYQPTASVYYYCETVPGKNMSSWLHVHITKSEINSLYFFVYIMESGTYYWVVCKSE